MNVKVNTSWVIKRHEPFTYNGTALDEDGNPVDLTGATGVAFVNAKRSYAASGYVSSMTFALVVAASGTYSVTLTAVATAALGGDMLAGWGQVWITLASGVVVQFCEANPVSIV